MNFACPVDMMLLSSNLTSYSTSGSKRTEEREETRIDEGKLKGQRILILNYSREGWGGM